MPAVTVELNQTLAELLAKLCVELGTDDYADVISRALGLLHMAHAAKHRGARIVFVDESGERGEVAL